MDIKLWSNFSKRVNSTKRPSDLDATTLSVRLKDNTSIENPTFIVSGNYATDYNYAFAFNHYYFIDDIVQMTNGTYQIICRQDLLATHKGSILNTRCMIEYASQESNSMIADTRLTMTNDIEVLQNTAPAFQDTHGTVILTVAGSNNTADVGFTSMYAINKVSINNLTSLFYSTAILDEIKKFFVNPYDSMIECHWIPWEMATSGTTIKVGNYELSAVSAYGLSGEVTDYGTEFTIDIPWKYNDWRDFQPYSILELYLPFYGIIILDQSKLVGQDSISVRIIKDAISGEVNYKLQSGDWFNTYRVDASVQLSMGQTTGQKPQSVAEMAIGTGAVIGAVASAIASGGMTSPMVATAMGGIGTYAHGMTTYFQEESSGKGGTGGFARANQVLQAPTANIMRKVALTMYSHLFADGIDNQNSYMGKPLFRSGLLSGYSGFVKCANASVSLQGLGNDREEVNAMLNSGIYIE